ncbi:hypothetical protein MUCCIDRAFT_113611 [Mucor lusitanicus CBS 277.49]|uniref:Transcription activator GCR1-like domain-containing protein n=1 Tax=Mucor lusitanicus CBS 277.49 TaxID=747725 RepID=A0A168INJ4_MUCCL|nr:hypothetical protein MUCCIDRAFT_113611 [Mucor lusitanicus CBS 277.49]
MLSNDHQTASASNVATTSTAPAPAPALPTEDVEMTSISNNALNQDTEMSNADISSNVDARGVLVQYEMARSIEETTRAVSEIRPIATKRAYEPKIKEFENWAKETFVHEPLEQRTILTGDKLNYFMRTKVVGRLSRKGKTPRKVASSTIDQYVAAVTDLHRSQVKMKINANSHPRLLVQDLILVEKEKDYQTKRENF